MTSIITRVYVELDQAKAAVAALAEDGFADRDVHLFEGESAKAETDSDAEAASGKDVDKAAIKDRLLAADISPKVAAACAERLAAGAHLVLLYGRFGSTRFGTEILDQHHPIADDQANAAVLLRGAENLSIIRPKKRENLIYGDVLVAGGRVSQDRLPFSSRIRMRTTKPFKKKSNLSSNLTPFASITKLKPISKPSGKKPLTKGHPAIFSNILGLPLLHTPYRK